MESQSNNLKQEAMIGWMYFAIFFVLIITGITVKRVYHHPEFIMFFHGPAAVFLILAGYRIPGKLRERYRQDCLRRTQ